MANNNKDVFWSVRGRKKAGADLTKALRESPGRSGKGVPRTTIYRWRDAGLIKQVDGKWVLTARGESA